MVQGKMRFLPHESITYDILTRKISMLNFPRWVFEKSYERVTVLCHLYKFY